MKYHVEDYDDFQHATEAELREDIKAAEAELATAEKHIPADYEAGQEVERAKERTQKRIDATLAELRRR